METKKTRRANYKIALVSLLPIAFPDDFPIIPSSTAGLKDQILDLYTIKGGLPSSVAEQMIKDPVVMNLWLQALSHWSVGLDPPQNFNMLKNIGHTLLKSIFVNYIISYKGKELLTGKGQTFLTKLSMYVFSNDLLESATDFFNLTPYIHYRALPYSIKNITYNVSVGIDMKNDVFEALIAAIVMSVDGCIMQGLGEAVATNVCFAFFDSIKHTFPKEMEDMEEPDTALMYLFKQNFKIEIFTNPFFNLSSFDNKYRATLKVDFRKDLQINDPSLPPGCCTFVSKPYENKSDTKKELGRTILSKLKTYNIKLVYKDKPAYKPFYDPSHRVQSFGMKDTNVFIDFIENILVTMGGWTETPSMRKQILGKTKQVWIDAFTHKTFDVEHNYEYYEKVGDVRVECCIFLYVYRRFPHLRFDHLGTGKFTECVQHIKEKKNFSRLAEKVGFVPFIRFKNSLEVVGDKQSQEIQQVTCDDGMKEDVFESFCGAVGVALDPFYTLGFGQGLLYNIISSILDEEPLTVDLDINKDSVTKLKEGFEDLFLKSGKEDPNYECRVIYKPSIKPGQNFNKGMIQEHCTLRVGWLLIENLKGSYNLYINKAYTKRYNELNEKECKKIAQALLEEKGYPGPYIFTVKPDFVGKLVSLGGKVRDGIFDISFSSSKWYVNDEVGKMEAKFDVARQALAFVENAGFVWKQKQNYYIHPTSTISISASS